MKLVNLVRDIILEQQVMNFDIGTYSFTDLKVTDKYIFFNGIKLTDYDEHDSFQNYNEPSPTEFLLVGNDGEFKFPSKDNKGKLVLMSSSHNNSFYVTKDNFTKYNPKANLEVSIGSIVKDIKQEGIFKNKMETILKSIYINQTTENGEPMYGESVKDDNCKTNSGVINFMGVKYGPDDKLVSNWSILNYFNTNSKVIAYLVNSYLRESSQTTFSFDTLPFINWLEKNGVTYFGNDSSHLEKLEELNLSTLRPGYIREQRALEILMILHNVDEGGITQYCPGSIEDTRYGRDLKINNENMYYQVKPLTGMMKMTDDGKYLIPTSNMKKYGKTVTRFIFINTRGNKYYIFDNRDYDVLKGGDFIVFNDKPLYESNSK
jgi:hypothetical protein